MLIRMSSGARPPRRPRRPPERVTQLDPHYPQPVQPVGTVLHCCEAAHRIVGKPGDDGCVRTVAQQPQRDVHADLGAPAGEQGPAPGQIRAGIALGPVDRGTFRTQLVVERVDDGVVVLADVAGPRPQQLPALAPTAVDTSGKPWVSSSIRPGAPVVVAAMTARSAAAIASRLAARRAFLTALNIFAVARRTATASGVLGRQCVHLGQHPQARAELVWIDRVHDGRVRGLGSRPRVERTDLARGPGWHSGVRCCGERQGFRAISVVDDAKPSRRKVSQAVPHALQLLG
ncbi:hypothetical protein M2272_005747 [Mycobacterium frederiksbergense]|uniref:Uncharacterized protein n=1 Tax=Mycolicibacterium frederiksbergense TaxID=117567 RepID=A0ABT6L841_9MYCO|nr:hypothetical protein [Mycolicibacterium frederiksbergense]